MGGFGRPHNGRNRPPTATWHIGDTLVGRQAVEGSQTQHTTHQPDPSFIQSNPHSQLCLPGCKCRGEDASNEAKATRRKHSLQPSFHACRPDCVSQSCDTSSVSSFISAAVRPTERCGSDGTWVEGPSVSVCARDACADWCTCQLVRPDAAR